MHPYRTAARHMGPHPCYASSARTASARRRYHTSDPRIFDAAACEWRDGHLPNAPPCEAGARRDATTTTTAGAQVAWRHNHNNNNNNNNGRRHNNNSPVNLDEIVDVDALRRRAALRFE